MGIVACGECGIPRLISLMHRWRDDGVLESRMGRARGILVERGAFVGTLDRIEEALGVPIDRIVIEAKRRDAKLYVDDVVSGVVGSIARLRPLRRLGYEIMVRQVAAIGLARARVLEYEPGVRLSGWANPVYHPALFVGDVCGAFESLEEKRARPDYGKVGESLYIELRTDENLPDEERLEIERVPEVPARAEYERCGTCGVPSRVRDLRWEMRQGKIFDRNTGEWVIYIDVEGLNAILRELEKELGETIPGLIAEHSFRYYTRLIRNYPGAGFSDLSFMKVRGMGVPETDRPTREQMAAGVRILNPFNGPMIAGIVAAVCGGVEGGFEWESPEPGVISVKVG